MNARFGQVDQRFVAIDQRFVAIDQRFVTTEQRFATMDQRFLSIESKLAGMDQKIDPPLPRDDGDPAGGTPGRRRRARGRLLPLGLPTLCRSAAEALVHRRSSNSRDTRRSGRPRPQEHLISATLNHAARASG
jgi:hypothetical protein